MPHAPPKGSALSRLGRLLRYLWGGRAALYAPMGNPLGRRSESAAAKFLRRTGYRVLARNVRTRAGEADLVCLDPDDKTIVLVEVKSRTPGTGPGGGDVPPEASVTAEKRRNLRAVARSLVLANGWEARPLRIDVVAVEWVADGGKRPEPRLRHHVNAVAR